MVTEALASRLSAAPDLWVAGCCTTDDPQLPEVVRWLRPDVILIEVEPLGFAVGDLLQERARRDRGPDEPGHDAKYRASRQSREESRQSPLRQTSLIAQIAPARCYPSGTDWLACACGRARAGNAVLFSRV